MQVSRNTRRGWAGLGFLLLATALITVVDSPAPVSAINGQPIAFGAFPQPRNGQSPQQAVTALETQIGRKLEVVRVFEQWGDAFPDSYHNFLKNGDRSMILSIKPIRNGTRISWPQIATAAPGSTVDNEMRAWARKIRDFNVPIWITLHHEPESGNNGNAVDFIAAWRRWVDTFRQEGATNAKFMWIMTDYSYQVAQSDRRYAPKWFPGADYIDAMAIDAYNWHVCRPDADNAWKTLQTIIEDFRRFGAQYPTEQLWLAEWGSWEDPQVANRKAGWFDQAKALFKTPNYSQFAGVVYFNSDAINPNFPNCLWFSDTSASSLASFRSMALDPFYAGDAFPSTGPVAPIARFTSACTGLVCTFTSTSTDPDGTIASYLWNTGATPDSTTNTATRTFPGTGSYPVTLTVTDNTGLTGTVTNTVAVTAPTPQPPVASFTSACTGLSCTFTSTSTDPDGTIASFEWNTGDGTTPTTNTASRTFPAPNTYPVTLTVTDNAGLTGTVTVNVAVDVQAPRPPVAEFTSSCTLLSCTFTSTSTDPDGDIASYAWNTGDGTTPTSNSASRTFPAAGTYPVSLVVTDSTGLTDDVSHDVTVSDVPPVAGPAFRAAASANTQTSAASVVVPGSVVSGDRLVLIITTNTATTATTPAGWTLLGTQSDGNPDMRSWVFTRAATAGTANSTVTSTLGASVKASRVLLAYSGAGVPTATSSVAGTTAVTNHTTPTTNPAAGSRVVSYWSDKTNGNTGWTVPGTVQVRQTSVGSSTGRITAAAADASATGGTRPGVTATSTTASTKAIMWSIVVPPTGAPPVNQPPTANFTSSCTGLACTFTSTSTDADGTIAGATWDFGGNGTGAGLTASHTFTAPGTYLVAVTVTDNSGAPASTSRNITVATVPVSPITFVNQASASTNATTHRVVVPSGVQTGDALILALTVNTNVTVGTPTGLTGWRQLAVQSNGSFSTRIWTRVATAGNAGTAITVTTSGTAKSSFIVAAYRGTSTVDPVAVFASSLETVSRTTHTTPTVNVSSDRSWVVSYWAHKDNASTALAAPAGVQTRATGTQTGSGRITALLADSNGAAGVGTAPGRTATAGAASSSASMWSIVLAPA